ncbi:hypothetical protein AB0D30_00940 [Streptomyces sp. NPDC048409]|uniref:hypothetical protein n=1 Tax=Streptomyces sp. NPDC048409 TaxID=3154723 RepID=UPI0034386608
MVNADLIRDLGRPDRYEAAADALVALGAGGVEQLVREVRDAESPVDWLPITAVLGRTGDAGFDGLLQELVSASTEESRKRVGFAFSRLGAAVVDRCTAALAHPLPLVRPLAVRGIEHCGEAGRPVRRRSGAAARRPGPGGRPAGRGHPEPYRRARDSAAPARPGTGPGRRRARALTVLAELGGEPALSPADTAAIERLIRIKLPDDRPEPLWACWNHWMAVPSGDQAGIMRTLGLTNPRPVTFALGNDIVDADGHGCETDEHTG